MDEKNKNEVITIDPKSGKWSYAITIDHSDLIKENLEAQRDGSNGWTDDRHFRRVGKIPYELYVDPDFQALTTPEKQLFLKWFLNKNPQFRTVDKLLHVGANDGHVIVK